MYEYKKAYLAGYSHVIILEIAHVRAVMLGAGDFVAQIARENKRDTEYQVILIYLH